LQAFLVFSPALLVILGSGIEQNFQPFFQPLF
jgi:hypothetical protein